MFCKQDLSVKEHSHKHSILCEYLEAHGDKKPKKKKNPITVYAELALMGLNRLPNEITKDAVSSNPLKRCFDYKKGNQRDIAKHILSANHLVDFMLNKEKTSKYEWGIIMGSLYDMLRNKVKFGSFFVHLHSDEDGAFIKTNEERSYSFFLEYDMLPESS